MAERCEQDILQTIIISVLRGYSPKGKHVLLALNNPQLCFTCPFSANQRFTLLIVLHSNDVDGVFSSWF